MQLIEVDLIEYTEKEDAYRAIMVETGREILVDPFVGMAWEWKDDKRFVKGNYTFLGYWYNDDESKGIFLPDKEVLIQREAVTVNTGKDK